jgi:hypothetical protein
MNAPDKCPRCGAGRFSASPNAAKFGCGSMHWLIGTPKYQFQQSNGCTETQRNQLRAQVNELQRERESMVKGLSDPNAVWVNMLRGTIAMPLHVKEADDRLNGLSATVHALESQVETLKAFAERLANAGDWLAVEAKNQNSLKNWSKAKETTP